MTSGAAGVDPKGPGGPDASPDPTRRHAVVPLAVGLFLASRALYWILGVRFDTSPLIDYWQYIDPPLLRGDLLASLAYLHSQPPLFNLFLGLVLKGAPAAYPVLFATVYLAMGLGLYLVGIALVRRLGLQPGWALGLVSLFSLLPVGVLYESWLFYPLPLALLLTGSALLLDGALRRPTGRRLLALFAVIATLCLTASPFHLVFYLAVVALVVGARRVRWQVTVGAALGPGFALLLLYGWHVVAFGRFGTQSWVGMSVAKVVLRHIPVAERRALVAKGTLSPLALITPFSALDAYPPPFRIVPPGTPDRPVLTAALKSTGATNYNHIAYLGIADRYLADTLVAARREPRAVVAGVGTAWAYYVKAGTDSPFLEPNRGRISHLAGLVERLVYLRAPAPLAYVLEPEDQSDWAWSVVIALPLLCAWGGRRAFRALRSADADERRRGWVLAYLVGSVVYVAVVGNTLEVVENNRFRVVTEPLILALGAAWLGERLAQGDPETQRLAPRSSWPATRRTKRGL